MQTRLFSTRLTAAILPALLSLACFSLVGCSAGKGKKYGVSGAVTFNGQPVPVGRIYFDPDPTRNGEGTQGFAEIKNGRYDTNESGKGIGGGAYTVRIEGFDGQATDRTPVGKPLFVTYTQSVELLGEEKESNFDVPASAAEGLGTEPTIDP